MRVLVTGGCGFIGSAVVRQLIGETEARVLNVDKLTYAGNPENVASVASDERYAFLRADVADRAAMREAFGAFRPTQVIHLAAESHVDRSLDAPASFLETNVLGTFALLEAARASLPELDAAERDAFRFVHVSTDEVFGSLGAEGAFDERSPYDPSSPYSASKAAADHLVRAWGRSYGLPAVVTNCGNNYGPFHFPEKLIPLVILNALEGRELPVYGTGANVRDWIHVDDHARALRLVAASGAAGATYAIGARAPRANLDLVRDVCALLDELAPDSPHRPHARLIRFVADRPGHDLRYAIEPAKIERELGWRPRRGFADGLRETVAWFLANRAWWEPLRRRAGAGDRLGLGAGAR